MSDRSSPFVYVFSWGDHTATTVDMAWSEYEAEMHRQDVLHDGYAVGPIVRVPIPKAKPATQKRKART